VSLRDTRTDSVGAGRIALDDRGAVEDEGFEGIWCSPAELTA